MADESGAIIPNVTEYTLFTSTVTGGSQGALPVNRALVDAMKALAARKNGLFIFVLICADLVLTELEQMSCPEIAAALQIPIGTVWTRLHAARRELRQVLGDDA